MKQHHTFLLLKYQQRKLQTSQTIRVSYQNVDIANLEFNSQSVQLVINHPWSQRVLPVSNLLSWASVRIVCISHPSEVHHRCGPDQFDYVISQDDSINYCSHIAPIDSLNDTSQYYLCLYIVLLILTCNFRNFIAYQGIMRLKFIPIHAQPIIAIH